MWVVDGNDDRLAALWPGGVADFEPDDPGLITALASARVQCEAYAPTLPADQEPPANYVHAQVLQARALIQAGVVDAAGDLAAGAGTIPTFAMDWSIKNLLRPKTRPVVG